MRPALRHLHRPPGAVRSAGRGFTLTELIVAIVVLGLLAALAVPAQRAVTARARDVAKDGDTLWLAAANGLFEHDLVAGTTVERVLPGVTGEYYRAVEVDDVGLVWLIDTGTVDAVRSFDPVAGTATANTLAGDLSDARGLAVDSGRGLLWLGLQRTAGTTVWELATDGSSLRALVSSLYVSDLARDGDVLYTAAAVSQFQVAAIDTRTGHWRRVLGTGVAGVADGPASTATVNSLNGIGVGDGRLLLTSWNAPHLLRLVE